MSELYDTIHNYFTNEKYSPKDHLYCKCDEVFGKIKGRNFEKIADHYSFLSNIPKFADKVFEDYPVDKFNYLWKYYPDRKLHRDIKCTNFSFYTNSDMMIESFDGLKTVEVVFEQNLSELSISQGLVKLISRIYTKERVSPSDRETERKGLFLTLSHETPQYIDFDIPKMMSSISDIIPVVCLEHVKIHIIEQFYDYVQYFISEAYKLYSEKYRNFSLKDKNKFILNKIRSKIDADNEAFRNKTNSNGKPIREIPEVLLDCFINLLKINIHRDISHDSFISELKEIIIWAIKEDLDSISLTK